MKDNERIKRRFFAGTVLAGSSVLNSVLLYVIETLIWWIIAIVITLIVPYFAIFLLPILISFIISTTKRLYYSIKAVKDQYHQITNTKTRMQIVLNVLFPGFDRFFASLKNVNTYKTTIMRSQKY